MSRTNPFNVATIATDTRGITDDTTSGITTSAATGANTSSTASYSSPTTTAKEVGSSFDEPIGCSTRQCLDTDDSTGTVDFSTTPPNEVSVSATSGPPEMVSAAPIATPVTPTTTVAMKSILRRSSSSTSSTKSRVSFQDTSANGEAYSQQKLPTIDQLLVSPSTQRTPTCATQELVTSAGVETRVSVSLSDRKAPTYVPVSAARCGNYSLKDVAHNLHGSYMRFTSVDGDKVIEIDHYIIVCSLFHLILDASPPLKLLQLPSDLTSELYYY